MERKVTERLSSPIPAADVGPIDGDYGGQSVTVIPLIVTAATPEAASARLDTIVGEILAVLQRHPDARLATQASDSLAMLEALEVTTTVARATYEGWRARQAASN